MDIEEPAQGLIQTLVTVELLLRGSLVLEGIVFLDKLPLCSPVLQVHISLENRPFVVLQVQLDQDQSAVGLHSAILSDFEFRGEGGFAFGHDEVVSAFDVVCGHFG